jgi:hypothetical protein
VLAWDDEGREEPRALEVGGGQVGSFAALPDGGLLVGTFDPLLVLIGPRGSFRWKHPTPHADFQQQASVLAASSDGTIVDFAFDRGGTSSRLRFYLGSVKLTPDPLADGQTARQKGGGLEDALMIAFPMDRNEAKHSSATHPDHKRFVLGGSWSLRAIDSRIKEIWRRDVPGIVRAVTITGDGRMVVAAYSDGTIRWHRMDDGRELLALYVLADKQNWVAWTPEGFYGATLGAFSILQWQQNRGFDSAAVTVPVSAIPILRRPDALPLVLQEMETHPEGRGCDGGSSLRG